MEEALKLDKLVTMDLTRRRFTFRGTTRQYRHGELGLIHHRDGVLYIHDSRTKEVMTAAIADTACTMAQDGTIRITDQSVGTIIIEAN